MIRKCFTINQHRTKEKIKSYEDNLVKTGLFKGCEIFYPYDVSVEQYNDYVNQVKEFLKYQDFEIVCHLPYGRINNVASFENIDEIMERLYKAIDFSAMFNVHKLTFHPGELDGTLSKEDAIKQSLKNVRKLIDYAKKYNMTLMIENLISSKELCSTKEEMKAYLEALNNEAKLIFDCGHCHASKSPNKNEIIDFVKLLKDELYHIHISDNDQSTDKHGKIGSGTIDFVTYFKTLKEINYQGLYSSEVIFHSYLDLIETSNKIDEIEKLIKGE